MKLYPFLMPFASQLRLVIVASIDAFVASNESYLSSHTPPIPSQELTTSSRHFPLVMMIQQYSEKNNKKQSYNANSIPTNG